MQMLLIFCLPSMFELTPPVVKSTFEKELNVNANSVNTNIFYCENENSRVEIFHEIIDKLLSNHDDGKLNTKLAQTSGWIAYVTFQSKELAFSCFVIACEKKCLIHSNLTAFLYIEQKKC